MLECVYCGNENPEKNNFCRACRRQIRCLICKEPLELDADMCFSCGEAIKDRRVSSTQNTYELDEAHNAKTGSSSRKIKVSFSDNALESVAPALSGMFGLASQTSGSLSQQRRILQPNYATQVQKTTLDALPQVIEANTGSTRVLQENIINNSSEMLYAFTLDEQGVLFTTINDFKGSKQSEQQRRFILLYILDYQSTFGKSPSDEVITEAADRLGFYEKANFKKYLKQIKSDYFVPAGETLVARDNLQSYLDQINAQLLDDSIRGISMSLARKQTRKRSASSQALTEVDMALINSIIDKYPLISQIDSRSLSHSELSALALYLLQKFESMQAVNVKVLHAIISATRGYSTEFRRYNEAIKKAKSKALHIKTDGNISLMPEGEIMVEGKLRDLGISL